MAVPFVWLLSVAPGRRPSPTPRSVAIPGHAATTNPAPTSCVCEGGRAGGTATCLPSGSHGGHHGVVSGVRDYLAWHEQYDDPGSSLSRRLALVRGVLREELDARPGPGRGSRRGRGRSGS